MNAPTGIQYRTFAIAKPDNAEEEDIALCCSSEEPVERSFGTEVLDHSPESVDMSRMTNGAPLLVNHNPDDQVGVVTPEEIARVEISKQRMDAYGVGVRAGCITPNLDDETALRAATELPAPSSDVAKSWTIDGGSRKPITLQSGKVATPNPSAPMQPQPQA